jgi:P27 family predicted phage terminase small subunit
MKGRTDPRAARRGTAGHHRKPTDIVPASLSGSITQHQATEVPLPRSVPHTKAAKDLWRTILTEVARHELRAGDLPLIEAMFVAKVRHMQAGAHVKKNGVMVEQVLFVTDDGTPVVREIVNPMLRVEREQALVYDRLAQRLGLSPEARIRLDLMQIAGATLLGSLRKSLEELADEDEPDADVEIQDAELVEE